MSDKCFLLVTGAMLFLQVNWAQEKKDSLVLQFHLKFDTTAITPNQKYVSKKKDTLEISTFKFYISNLQFEYADKSVFQAKDFYHLVDLEATTSQRIPITSNSNKEIKKITFAIGIDSLANVSGASAGALDPTKGMYWAWQSGYINMKIEGKSNSCKTHKNQFQFHIGGYLSPNNAIRTVSLNVNSRKSILDISANIATILNQIELVKTNSIMIPGKTAMQLADYSRQLFQIE